jgi:hypothetical protein
MFKYFQMWCKEDNQELVPHSDETSFSVTWGNWGRMVNCTGGFSSAKVRIEVNQYLGDDTAMNCIQLYCDSSRSWEQGRVLQI